MAEYKRGSDGSFLFPGDHCQLIVCEVNRDRYGKLYGHAVVLTTDGAGYLAMGIGELTSEQFRYRLAAEAAKRNSGDTNVIENHVFAATLALLDDPNLAPSSSTTPPTFTPLPEYLNGIDPRRRDLVVDLLEFGHTYLLAGRYKSGKSILIMNLVLVTARGGWWLGREVKPGPVYWLQLEDSDRIIARRWQRMAGAPSANVHIARGPWHSCDENLEATIGTVKGAALVVVDPIISASDVEKWADMHQVRKAYEYWRLLARETDAVVMILAHHRKMDGSDGDQVAGSHQAGAAVDGIVEMRKGGSGIDANERRLSFTGRDWADLEDEVIALNPETLVFEPVGTYREKKEEADTERAEIDANTLAEALGGKPMLRTELRDCLHWNGDRFFKALHAAVEQGLVHQNKDTNPASRRKATFVFPGPKLSEE
jgi:hypothetical protein